MKHSLIAVTIALAALLAQADGQDPSSDRPTRATATSIVVTTKAPSPDVPELAVLRYLAGNFQTKVVEPVKTRSRTIGKWIHGGRFLRQTWAHQPTDTSIAINGTIVVTYDVSTKTYRQWSFDSTGTIFESTGEWDKDSRTMTWSGTSGGISHTWKQSVDKNGGFTWSIVMKDRNENTIYQTRGVTSRAGTQRP